MTDGATRFAYNVDDRVEFKDGRNIRTAFVVTQEPATDDYPKGYMIRFFMPEVENGRIMLARWAESDMKAAGPQAFQFKKDDNVKVDLDDGDGQVGVVLDRRAPDKENLTPSYAVLMSTPDGRTDLAWWDEYMLVAAI